jgi:hypothetical protein
MKTGSKEFIELMSDFERLIKSGTIYLSSTRLDKEEKELWKRGYYYQNGELNSVFKGFILGYQNAKCLARMDALILDE